VTQPNQAWAMDISYIPMARGFIYLAAVVNWFSRKILAWKLSITMDVCQSRFFTTFTLSNPGPERKRIMGHHRNMVVPICSQCDWRRILTGLPAFLPGSAPMLVIAPHPDDETLATGGLLCAQRGNHVSIMIAAVTNGENAYAGNEGLGELRITEQTLAAARLGIGSESLLRLQIADTKVGLNRSTVVERLLPFTTSETHILAPWPYDFHPDHEACGVAARELAEQTGARLTFYFFWTWHRGTPALLEGLGLHAFPLDAAQRIAKAEALAFHASQLHHPSGDPILHDIHLWPALLPFEVYLPA
jgi:LmbE family N-acetylglucosaminyl deacetylase